MPRSRSQFPSHPRSPAQMPSHLHPQSAQTYPLSQPHPSSRHPALIQTWSAEHLPCRLLPGSLPYQVHQTHYLPVAVIQIQPSPTTVSQPLRNLMLVSRSHQTLVSALWAQLSLGPALPARCLPVPAPQMFLVPLFPAPLLSFPAALSLLEPAPSSLAPVLLSPPVPVSLALRSLPRFPVRSSSCPRRSPAKPPAAVPLILRAPSQAISVFCSVS